jgi:glycosyl transferase family 25
MERSMQVFIISLQDSKSEANLNTSSILGGAGFEVSFIDAVYGPDLNAKSYFSAVQWYLSSQKRLITPSELGCMLSHKKAYEAFVRTSDSHALIFEDDVIVDASACADIKRILEKIGNFDGYLHLGGQEGLGSSFERVSGTLLCEEPYVFRVNPDDLAHLFRTVGYLVSSAAAKEILRLLDAHAFLIDDFTYIKENSAIGDFYFSNIVKHPVDLSTSAIERERAFVTANIHRPRLIGRVWGEINAALHQRFERVFDKIIYKQKIINQLRAVGLDALSNK